MSGVSLLVDLAGAAPADDRDDTLLDACVLDGEETTAVRALYEAQWFTSDFADQARHQLLAGKVADDPIAETVAAILRDQFGQRSVTVAAWSAFLAWNDDRQLAYRFWFKVFACLQPL